MKFRDAYAYFSFSLCVCVCVCHCLIPKFHYFAVEQWDKKDGRVREKENAHKNNDSMPAK